MKSYQRRFGVCLVQILALLGIIANDAVAKFPSEFPSEFRTIDGTYNNQQNPIWGSANIELLRLTSIGYEDGLQQPAGSDRFSAREISNIVDSQAGSVPNTVGVSDFVWQWGQFLDHDVDLTEPADPAEPFNIPVPTGDLWFDPDGTGEQVIPLNRSAYNTADGTRQQLNLITAYIDASNVYGSDPTLASELRTLDGTGRLKMSPGRLLPEDPRDPDFFLAGDVRANEQVALTAMHTLFAREHNYWASVFRKLYPFHKHQDRSQRGEHIYQCARAIVAAEIQAITYNEFLPVLLGPNALEPYTGYNPAIDTGIANVFSTAAYRFGHSMLNPFLLRLKKNGKPIAAGNLPLRNAFFNPLEIIKNGGIEPLLRGLASQTAQDVDNLVVDDVRNFLFGEPGEGGFDLPSLNIQRGRDHGLPDYQSGDDLINS